MAGCIRRLPLRRMLLAGAAAVVVCLLWRGGPVTVGAVLGWGLGVVPVHATLRGPESGPARSAEGRADRRRIRRPAEEYARGRQGDGRADEPGGHPGGPSGG